MSLAPGLLAHLDQHSAQANHVITASLRDLRERLRHVGPAGADTAAGGLMLSLLSTRMIRDGRIFTLVGYVIVRLAQHPAALVPVPWREPFFVRADPILMELANVARDGLADGGDPGVLALACVVSARDHLVDAPAAAGTAALGLVRLALASTGPAKSTPDGAS